MCITLLRDSLFVLNQSVKLTRSRFIRAYRLTMLSDDTCIVVSSANNITLELLRELGKSLM